MTSPNLAVSQSTAAPAVSAPSAAAQQAAPAGDGDFASLMVPASPTPAQPTPPVQAAQYEKPMEAEAIAAAATPEPPTQVVTVPVQNTPASRPMRLPEAGFAAAPGRRRTFPFRAIRKRIRHPNKARRYQTIRRAIGRRHREPTSLSPDASRSPVAQSVAETPSSPRDVTPAPQQIASTRSPEATQPPQTPSHRSNRRVEVEPPAAPDPPPATAATATVPVPAGMPAALPLVPVARQPDVAQADVGDGHRRTRPSPDRPRFQQRNWSARRDPI